jgi:hypothetical protein
MGERSHWKIRRLSQTQQLAILGLLGIAALVTIFVGGGSGKTAEPPPLPAAPTTIIRTVSRDTPTALRVQVGQYLVLDLPTGHSYSTVVEQTSTADPVVEDLKLPGQLPQLRADRSGHATVQVMSEPVCDSSGTCPDRRTLFGTLDVTVTP